MDDFIQKEMQNIQGHFTNSQFLKIIEWIDGRIGFHIAENKAYLAEQNVTTATPATVTVTPPAAAETVATPVVETPPATVELPGETVVEEVPTVAVPEV